VADDAIAELAIEVDIHRGEGLIGYMGQQAPEGIDVIKAGAMRLDHGGGGTPGSLNAG
jgi:hypothetical protein